MFRRILTLAIAGGLAAEVIRRYRNARREALRLQHKNATQRWEGEGGALKPVPTPQDA